MRNLMSANFIRLRKSKFFRAEMAFMFGLALLIIMSQYTDFVKYGIAPSMGNVFFSYALPIGIASAVFSSIFLGSEYSDGTIRNKVIIGHSRVSIYLANLAANIAAALLLCLSYILAATAVGIPLLGPIDAKPSLFLLALAGTLMLTVAFCAIFTMISMLCSNKAAVAVISILLAGALFLAALYINGRLDASEYVSAYAMGPEGTKLQQIANPKYLTGTARAIYQFFYDFLPTGQAIQYAIMTAVHLWQMPLYSVIIAAVTTAVGIVGFNKKDIK